MASTNKYDVFLSFDWLDHKSVMVLADKLRAQNLKVYVDRWYLRPGSPWPQELDRILAVCGTVAICIGSRDMANWQQREILYSLERKKADTYFQVIPVLLPGSEPALGLFDLSPWIDLRQGLDQSLALTMLAAVIRRRPLGHDFQESIKEGRAGLNPYKGLSYFREEDAPFFYGREETVKILDETLHRCRFVAVAGASGSGKTSLVLAGLLPKMRMDFREPWEILTIVPGESPLYNLTAAFMSLCYPGLDASDRLLKIAEHQQALEKQPTQVINWINVIKKLQPGSRRFLLVVDQWEELYALTNSSDKHHAREINATLSPVTVFIDALLAAAEADVLSVVLTIRADFLGHVYGYRPLADRLQNSQINLGPLKKEELRSAIEKPADKAGSGFEDGLVDCLLNDSAINNPRRLPLLEYALQRLWDDPERRGGKMRHLAYSAMQGLEGALIRTADEVFRSLSDHEKTIAQRLMTRLVQVGDGVDDTCKRAPIAEFKPEVLAIIKHLTDNRLLVTKQRQESDHITVELANEALIRQWKLFRDWLNNDRQFYFWRVKLGFLREQHQWLGHENLAEARRWMHCKQDELDKDELDYIQTCSRRSFIRKSGLAAMVLLPLSLAASFALWVATEALLTPKLGVYVLLAKAGVTFFLEPEMVAIPPEDEAQNPKVLSFLMGSAISGKNADVIEHPQHQVTFTKPFRMSRYEITFEEYLVFAYLINREGGCEDKHKVETSRVQDENWGRGKRPAINVSWNDATCYAQWLSKITGVKSTYRLPTEAEWEYAARAGTDSVFWWGSAMENQMAVCDGCRSDWQGRSERKQTAEVNDPGFKPNAWGLYHTSGNVWEWVQDCWHDNYYSAPADGSAWLSQNNGNCGRHVLRGGSWVDTPVGLRSAHRYKLNADYRYYNVGFRLAQD